MISKMNGFQIVFVLVASMLSSVSSFANTIDFSRIKHCKEQSFEVPALFQGFYGADQLGAVQGISIEAKGAETIWNNMTIRDLNDGKTYPMGTEYYQSAGFCTEETIKTVDGLQALEITLRKDMHQVVCSTFVKHVFQVRYSPIALSHAGPMYQVSLNGQVKSWGLCGSYYNDYIQVPLTEIPAPRPLLR